MIQGGRQLPSQLHTFSGGMDMDTEPDDVTSDRYRYAMNLQLTQIRGDQVEFETGAITSGRLLRLTSTQGMAADFELPVVPEYTELLAYRLDEIVGAITTLRLQFTGVGAPYDFTTPAGSYTPQQALDLVIADLAASRPDEFDIYAEVTTPLGATDPSIVIELRPIDGVLTGDVYIQPANAIQATGATATASWSKEDAPEQDDLQVIGWDANATELVLVTTASANTAPDTPPTLGQVWLVDIGDYEATLTVTVASNLVYSERLNLSIANQAEVRYIKESDCIKRVFWTDNFNPPRALDIGDGFVSTPADQIAFVPNVPIPIIEVGPQVAGQLPIGAYAYAVRGVTTNGLNTPFGIPTLKYNAIRRGASPGNEWASTQGGNLGENSGRGNTITVTGIDPELDEVEVYALYYITEGGNPEAVYPVYQGPFTSSSVTFVHTESQASDGITVEDIIVPPLRVGRAKNLLLADNRLILGNYCDQVTQIEFDTAGIVLDHVFKWIRVDDDTLPTDSNGNDWRQIDPYTGTLEAMDVSPENNDTTEPNPTYDNEYPDYKGPTSDYELRGYRRGETYRFGILFFFLDGTRSDVFWIGDYTFPSLRDGAELVAYDDTLELTTVASMGLDVQGIDLSQPGPGGAPLQDSLTGFSIVRAELDRQIIAQGIALGISRFDGTLSFYVDPIDAPDIDTWASFYATFDMSGVTSITQVNYRVNPGGPLQNHIFGTPIPFPGGIYQDPISFGPNGKRNLSGFWGSPGPDTTYTGRYEIVSLVTNAGLRSPLASAWLSDTKDPSINRPAMVIYSPDLDLNRQAVAASDQIEVLGVLSTTSSRYFSDSSASDGAKVKLHRFSFTPYAANQTIPFSVSDAFRVAQNAEYETGLGTTFRMELARTNTPPYVGIGDGTLALLDAPFIEPMSSVSFSEDFIEFMYPVVALVNVIRPKQQLYGGTGQAAIEATRYIYTGHYQPVSSSDPSTTYDARVYGGDVFVGIYARRHTSGLATDLSQEPAWQQSNPPANTFPSGANLRSTIFSIVGRLYSFPCESNVNVGLRYNVETGIINFIPDFPGQNNITGQRTGAFLSQAREAFLYDPVYSRQGSLLTFGAAPDQSQCSEICHPTRIIASLGQPIGGSENNWVLFDIESLRDIDARFGQLNHMDTLSADGTNYLYLWLERAFYFVVYGTQTLSFDSVSGQAQVGSGSVFGLDKPINEEVGCLHKWSVKRARRAFYWVDAATRRAYRFAQNGLDNLGESKRMATWWQENVGGIAERDNPIFAGGFTTGYDEQNGEVLFTRRDPVGQSWTLSYNINTGTWVSFQGFIPGMYMDLSGLRLLSPNPLAPSEHYRHNRGDDFTAYYGTGSPSPVELSFVLNEARLNTKLMAHLVADFGEIWDSVEVLSEIYSYGGTLQRGRGLQAMVPPLFRPKGGKWEGPYPMLQEYYNGTGWVAGRVQRAQGELIFVKLRGLSLGELSLSKVQSYFTLSKRNT